LFYLIVPAPPKKDEAPGIYITFNSGDISLIPGGVKYNPLTSISSSFLLFNLNLGCSSKLLGYSLLCQSLTCSSTNQLDIYLFSKSSFNMDNLSIYLSSLKPHFFIFNSASSVNNGIPSD